MPMLINSHSRAVSKDKFSQANQTVRYGYNLENLGPFYCFTTLRVYLLKFENSKYLLTNYLTYMVFGCLGTFFPLGASIWAMLYSLLFWQ